jgi:hypothetical protein
MNVPSPLDILLLMLWPAALFFGVWGIIIGRRADRLARFAGTAYGILAVALQLPLFAAWLGFLGHGYNDQDAVAWLVGSIPTILGIVALVLSFWPRVDKNPIGQENGR